jgi:lipopolysaccharide export system ATP-binding protein
VKKKRKTKASSARQGVSPALREDSLAFEQIPAPEEQAAPASEEQAAAVSEETALVFEEIQAVFEEVPPSIDAVLEEEQPYMQAASAAAPSFSRQPVVAGIRSPGGSGSTGNDFFAKQQASYEPSADGETLLYTRGLVKIYDGRTVVNGVDIEVRRGEIVGLLGPNGAGKTTSFYMIVGLVQPNGGKVYFDNKEVTGDPMYQRARLGMGYLPQEESIFRKLTVRENILAVMETQDFSDQEREAQCQQLMEKFGIDHVANNLALTLSGGEKRRLTIARSLVTEPKLIMLDEPFSGVDPLAVEDIQKIILMLKSVGLAILITDHNVRETLSIVDRAYLIHEGKVLLHGTRESIVNDPVARERYLGENFSM